MSDRDQDPNFFTIIRDMRERIKVLETTQNNAVKRNDIRLSDTIVRADSPNDQLCLENLVTHQIVCIGAAVPGDPTQAQWSFSGDITPADEGTVSPPFMVERETIARQIVLAQPCGQTFTGNVIFCVSFCLDSGQSADQRVTLAGTLQHVVYEINVPVIDLDVIQVTLIDAPGAGAVPNDISVFVRFGTPTVGLSSDTCAG